MALIAREAERQPVSATNVERYGTRDLSYNNWHRGFVGLGLVDIDHVEMCLHCQAPLALIETAQDIGQSIFSKKAHVTRRLAEMASLSAYVALYGKDEASGNLVSIRYLMISPTKGTEFVIEPDEWAEVLYGMHTHHEHFGGGCPRLTNNRRGKGGAN